MHVPLADPPLPRVHQPQNSVAVHVPHSEYDVQKSSHVKKLMRNGSLGLKASANGMSTTAIEPLADGS